MKASEALKLAEAARSLDGEYKRKETNDILGQIKVQASIGNVKIYVYDSIDPIVVNRLRVLGYIVKETNDQRDGYMAEVIWGK